MSKDTDTCVYMSYEEGHRKSLAAVKTGLKEPVASVHVIPIGEDDTDVALAFAKRLRAESVSCVVDTRGAKVKKALGLASDNGAYFAALIGNDERANGTITLKDLDERSQQTLPVGEAIAHLVRMCKVK